MSHPPRTSGKAERDLAAKLLLVEQLQPALEQRDRARQSDVVRQLVAMRAPMGGQWRALANLALQNGEISLARQAMDLFVEAQGSRPSALYMKAAMLEQAGALREAYDLMCSLPPDQPDPAAHAYSRGTAAIYLGETEEALRQLDTATRLRPNFGPAWMSLSRAIDLAREANLADRLLAAEEAIGNAPPEHRAPYWFTRGKLHAERGEHDRAFAAYARGGREMKALASYHPEKDRRGAQESIEGFSPERIAAIAGEQREPTDRSIFVTGLPRSGTTLVEQILASHSAVNDGGEVNRLFLLACEIRGDTYDALARYVDEHGAVKAAKLWRHWLQERFPTPGRVVDKSINTTRFIGLAAALLPDAPLIWLTRDPLDRAWSCFSTFFTTGMEWSYDLEDIAHHFKLEDELLRRWQAILGPRLLVAPYEELVCEPETWTRRILAHCDLGEEPQVFTPHLTERTITTASTMQVRRPINRQAIGSSEPYRQFLEPFIRAYNG